MKKSTLLGTMAIVAAAITSPALAQNGGMPGPGSSYGLEPAPTYNQNDEDRFAPSLNGNGSYARMPNESFCAQRYRSYDPRSRTFLGRDGQRHPCE
ncbi:BA14K family protein [Bradyrhizobium sp. dw_78]|uniref:BA14K family protein n=1 Tax=Bradyrhizobium sp. dw_78 TaxID=2719793 RepID=UPI001BD588C5|nr:BA14K family protein [Bradyrhizobium sp. dw_78]